MHVRCQSANVEHVLRTVYATMLCAPTTSLFHTYNSIALETVHDPNPAKADHFTSFGASTFELAFAIACVFNAKFALDFMVEASCIQAR